MPGRSVTFAYNGGTDGGPGQRGVAMVEMVLLLALVAGVALVGIQEFGSRLRDRTCDVTVKFESAVSGQPTQPLKGYFDPVTGQCIAPLVGFS